MRPEFAAFASASLAAVLVAAMALPASAACTRLGFSVNDYGKDGPTKDAKALLDKYIAKWATEHNISKYRTGTKDVKCELFLNFIVFDEHTCEASATVCWEGAPVSAPQSAGLVPSGTPSDKPAFAPVKKTAVMKAAKPDADKIETGAVVVPKPATVAAPAAVVVAPPTLPKPATAQPAAADQAMIAAQKAADAAERAAAAAERAAAAAMAAERANNVIAVPPPAAAAAAGKP